jgi:hypothetical protein
MGIEPMTPTSVDLTSELRFISEPMGIEPMTHSAEIVFW